MNEIHIVDTTLRDGQLSLWALGMRTGGDAGHRGTNVSYITLAAIIYPLSSLVQKIQRRTKTGCVARLGDDPIYL
jgi:hypothetical protein